MASASPDVGGQKREQRPIVMGLPSSAIKRGFSAVNMPLGFLMKAYHAN